MPSSSKHIVVIQNRESRLYFTALDVWTRDIDEAMKFENTREAHRHACDGQLRNCDVVMHFGDPAYDVRIEAKRAG